MSAAAAQDRLAWRADRWHSQLLSQVLAFGPDHVVGSSSASGATTLHAGGREGGTRTTVDATGSEQHPGHPSAVCRCSLCEACVPSLAALRSHWAQVHGYASPAKYFADGTCCGAYLKEFHSRPRLFQHLAYASKGCLALLMHRWSPLSREEVEAADELDRIGKREHRAKGRQKYWAEQPVMRCQGPLLRP